LADAAAIEQFAQEEIIIFVRRDDDLQDVIRWRFFREFIQMKFGRATEFAESCRDEFANL